MKGSLRKFIVQNNAFLVLLVLVLFGCFFVNYFTKTQNLINILVEVSLYGVLAIGLGVVIMAGAIDLSIAYQVVVAATAAILCADIGGVWLAVLGALAAGVLMGAFNGFVVTKMKIAPLIATIATMMAYNGLAMWLTNNGSLSAANKGFKQVFKFALFDVKVLQAPVIVFVVLILLLAFFLRRTELGRNLMFTGGNAEASTLAGIRTDRIVFFSYVVCGLCCGIAGMFIASRVNAATITQAENLSVAAISACVIGGISISGGKGSATKILVGVLIMRVINKIMDLKTLPGSWVSLISGLLLVGVLIVDRYTGGREKK